MNMKVKLFRHAIESKEEISFELQQTRLKNRHIKTSLKQTLTSSTSTSTVKITLRETFTAFQQDTSLGTGVEIVYTYV